MATQRTEKTIFNIAGDLSVKMVGILMSFVLRTVFIRMLGVEYSGVSGLFSDILGVLSFAELGIGGAITYALYKPLAEQNQQKIAQLMHFYRNAYRLVAATIMAGGLCLVPFLGVLVTEVPHIRESLTLIYILYLANSAASYLCVYRSILLSASQNQYMVSKVNILWNIIKNLGQCALLLVFQAFIPYLIFGIATDLGRNLMISHIARKKFPEQNCYQDERLPKSEAKAIFRDIKALAVERVSNVMVGSTDSVIISALLSTALVGYLSNYKLIVSTINVYVCVFADGAIPSIGNLAATEDRATQYQLFQKYRFILFWITCFCVTSLIVLLSPCMGLWLGPDFILGMPVVLMLVFDFYLTNTLRAVSVFRNANGLFKETQYCALAMAVINLAVSLLLVKPLGVLGVIIGTVVARLVTQMWYEPLLVYRKVFEKPVFDYVKSAAVYLAVTVLCVGSTYWVSRSALFAHIGLQFLAMMALCVLLPNAIIVLFFHRTEEFRYTIGMIRRLVQSFKDHMGQRRQKK